jgi:hypothetical protein
VDSDRLDRLVVVFKSLWVIFPVACDEEEITTNTIPPCLRRGDSLAPTHSFLFIPNVGLHSMIRNGVYYFCPNSFWHVMTHSINDQ